MYHLGHAGKEVHYSRKLYNVWKKYIIYITVFTMCHLGFDCNKMKELFVDFI